MTRKVVAQATTPIVNPQGPFKDREWTLYDDGSVTVYDTSSTVHRIAYRGKVEWFVDKGSVWMAFDRPDGYVGLANPAVQAAYEKVIALLVVGEREGCVSDS